MKTALNTLIKAVIYMVAIFILTGGIFLLVYKLNADANVDTYVNVHVPVILKSTAIFAAISGVCFAVVGIFKKLPAIFGYLIDFCLSYGAFCLWYKMLEKAKTQPTSRFFALSAVFVIIFSIVAGLGALVKYLIAKKKKSAPEQKYEKLFSDPDAENK